MKRGLGSIGAGMACLGVIVFLSVLFMWAAAATGGGHVVMR